MPEARRQKPATMHARILADIKGRISSGEWKPGERIPIETKLAEDFGVSRMTVNKVLTGLTRTGVLERKRKLGTIVCVPKYQLAVLEIADIGEEARVTGTIYSYQLLERTTRTATAEDLNNLGISGAKTILALTCLHHAGQLPFCLEERIINLDAVPDARDMNFRTEGPNHWLLGHVPWSSARHVINARAANSAMASSLKIKTGTACLVVERLTEDKGVPITYARLTYPGDRHQMVTQFAPPA